MTYGYQASSGQMGSGSTAGNADQLMSISGSIGGLTESASYTYDLQRRIVTSSQTTNGTSIQRRFAYDRWGNRTGVWDATSGGNQIQSVSLTQSGSVPTNQITSVTTSGTLNYSYDAAGNVTNDGVNTWVYDAENRIVSRNSGTDTFQYDHANRRIKKTSSASGAAIHYVWQGSQVIAEHNSSSGAVIVDYIYAGGRMIAKEESGRSFFLNDRLSVRAVITDGQGGIQGRQAHLPFGEGIGISGQQEKHNFTSYERDSESGTDYAVNRQYTANIGRFMRGDPYQGSYIYYNPQSLNRYSYGQNDAINTTDPTGLVRIVICSGVRYAAEWDPVGTPDGCIVVEVGDNEPDRGEGETVEGSPPACDVVVPDDNDIQAAVAVVMGEATIPSRLGQRSYQDGDRVGRPTGEFLTETNLNSEVLAIVNVIANRAESGRFGGSTWAEVAAQQGAFQGYRAGIRLLRQAQRSQKGSDLCQKLERAVFYASAVKKGEGRISGLLFFVAVVQGRTVRRRGFAIRFGDTDFSNEEF